MLAILVAEWVGEVLIESCPGSRNQHRWRWLWQIPEVGPREARLLRSSVLLKPSRAFLTWGEL